MKNHLLLNIMVFTSLSGFAVNQVKAIEKKADTAVWMINASLDKDANLEVVPSKNSSAADFDFLVGKWAVSNEKLVSRLTNCTQWNTFPATNVLSKTLLGTGNVDHFYTTIDGKDFEGMTVRLFNPHTKLWSLYWADSNQGKLETPVVGSFENHIGTFYAKDVWNGRPVIVMFRWDATNSEKPVWSQAFSADNGKTWEWNWYMRFYKAGN